MKNSYKRMLNDQVKQLMQVGIRAEFSSRIICCQRKVTSHEYEFYTIIVYTS